MISLKNEKFLFQPSHYNFCIVQWLLFWSSLYEGMVIQSIANPTKEIISFQSWPKSSINIINININYQSSVAYNNIILIDRYGSIWLVPISIITSKYHFSQQARFPQYHQSSGTSNYHLNHQVRFSQYHQSSIITSNHHFNHQVRFPQWELPKLSLRWMWLWQYRRPASPGLWWWQWWWWCYIQVELFDWSHPKNSKYGTGPCSHLNIYESRNKTWKST